MEFFFWLKSRWRSGQTVSSEEQFLIGEMDESMSAAHSVTNVAALGKPTPELELTTSHISPEDRTRLSEEREKLFQLLDAKVIC